MDFFYGFTSPWLLIYCNSYLQVLAIKQGEIPCYLKCLNASHYYISSVLPQAAPKSCLEIVFVNYD